MPLPLSVWLGFDPRESAAFAVARATVRHFIGSAIPVHGVVLDDLRASGLYNRPTETRIGRWQGTDGKHWSSVEPVLWDVISQWTMATEFAISRFLVPHLARQHMRGWTCGWALFMDCDVLVRSSIRTLFDEAQRHTECAVRVVKHDYTPRFYTKMDGQPQTQYSRKNWSSVCMFNCDHPSNMKLTPDLVNSVPGRDLHNFCWLNENEIGELDPTYNFLVGEQNGVKDPKIVHFTNGGPWMRGYEDVPFADEWRKALRQWAS